MDEQAKQRMTLKPQKVMMNTDMVVRPMEVLFSDV